MKKPVVRKLSVGSYDDEAPKRIFPIDKYEFDPAFLEGCEYHILLVPISGQYYARHGETTPDDWCGRTASTMLYNYFALLAGGDPRDRYVTLWKGDHDAWPLELRWPSVVDPDKGRAFHNKPHVQPTKRDLNGAQTITHEKNGKLGSIEIELLKGRGYSREFHLVPSSVPTGPSRVALGKRIAADPRLIEQAFDPVIRSLKNNNPCVVYTRFSDSANNGHIVCINGYVKRPDGSLWIAVADPETFKRRVARKMFKLVKDLSNPQPDENLIWVLKGNWPLARGSLVMIRASHFFAEHFSTRKVCKGSLFIDYACGSNGPDWGRVYASPDTYTEVPGGVALTSTRLPEDPTARFDLHYPFALGDGKPSSPVNNFLNNESGQGGFFPLGLRRNVHSGVHLRPFPAEPDLPEPLPKVEAPAEEGAAPAPDPASVRAMAPGYVVAARLGAATDAGQKVVGGHLGFVLLRHELKQLSEPDAEGDGGGEEEDRHVLYSLYMHLAPLTPDELAAGQGPPWLERLLAQSNGQVVGAGSSALAPGEVRWASAPLEGPDLSGEVEVRGPEGTAALDLGQPVPDEGRPVMAVLKPAPADLDQAKQAFAQGHVATFDRPLIPIAGGEVIGTVSPYPGIDPEELETGFLHWEVFAPEGAGISKVLELAKELVGEEPLGGEIALGESEEEQANLLKAETLGELLKPLLPDDEQQAADHEEGFLSRWHYEPILRELFNHPSVLSFANSANDDVEWEDWAAPDPLSVEDASERVAAKLATPSETGAQTGADPEAGAETGAETGAPLAPHPYDGDLTYPLTLQVENFAPESWKPSAAEPFHLEVSFKPDWLRQRGALALDSSAEEWTFTIQVPAAATKIVLEPRDGSFRIDTIIDLPEPLEVQKKALTALLPRRWRGVKLTRTPEYALETVKATVAPRFNDIDALAPYLEPIAWWNSGKEGEDARPREVAVLGAEGQETSLFTAEGLPPEGKLDFLNPIAGLWLLNTLVVGGRAAFVGPDELAKVDADGGAGKLLDWGLIPPSGVSLEAASVGQLVHALVVTDDYASGREVVLEAKPSGGGDSAELGTFLTRAGVVSVPLALSGWGKWTLEIKGEQGQSRAALPLEVTIATPTLGAVADPKRKPKQSVYSWILPFSSHAPGELQVWIGLRTAAIEIGSDAPPASWEEQALRIPALATLLPEEPSEDARGIKWSSGGDLVLGARRGKGDVSLPSAGYKTNRFKVSEFFNATVGASQVSLRAIQLLNTIRLAYKKSLRIVAVEDEGWKILSGDSSARNSETAYQKLLKVGKEVLTELQSGPESAAWENCQVEGDPNRKSIAISATPPPRTAGGSLELLFDPSLALAELVETKGESIQPGHCLGVSFGLVAPQSGWGDPTLADEEKIGEIVFPAKASEAGNDEAIVAWTPDPIAHLVNVSFGALSATVHGDWLTLSAPLQGGTLPDWRRAKPRIALGGTVLKSAIVATDASQTGSAGAETGAVGEVSAKIKLSKIGGQATFSAKTLISPATFHGVETTVGAPELSLDSTPRLEEAEVLPHDKDPGRVVVRCKAPYLPAGKGLKLKVSKAGAEIKELGLAATFHVANKGTGGALKGSGCRDDDWDVIAQLTLEELRDHFEDGETIDFEFYRPSGWEEPTLSPITASTPMPAEPRIQEEAKMQPLEN